MNFDTKYVNVSGTFLVANRYLSPQVAGVWLTLLSYWFFKKKKEGKEAKRINDYVKPSLNSMLMGLNISKKHLRKCLKELEILGFITKKEKVFIKGKVGYFYYKYWLDDEPVNINDKLDELWEFQNLKSVERHNPQDIIEYRIGENEPEIEE